MGKNIAYYGDLVPLLVFRNLDTLGLGDSFTVTSAALTMVFHSQDNGLTIKGQYLNVPWYWDFTQAEGGGSSSKFGWRERDDRSK